MTTITMPRLSDSMEEGTILEWLIDDGAEVGEGDDLIEVETDKATMVHPSPVAGVVHRLVAAGETVAVGVAIAQVLAPGEAAPPAAAPVPAVAAKDADAQAADAPAAPPQAAQPPSGRAKASPLARRIARDLNLDLAGLSGSGPGGRIMRADVESAAKPVPADPIAAPAATRDSIVELTRIQQKIARRMSEAKATIPDFQVRTEVDVTELQELRGRMKVASIAVSVNDFVVRACALALARHPRANGSFRDGAFHLHGEVNVGVAVAAPDVLLVPVVREADRKSVAEIGAATRALASRVRDGSVTPPDLAGGTFTVSNLGMFGVSSFTAVVNPGQAAILAVGAAREHLVRRDGEIEGHEILELSLSCDHRILYGADAAAFLADLRELLETPLTLLA